MQFPLKLNYSTSYKILNFLSWLSLWLPFWSIIRILLSPKSRVMTIFYARKVHTCKNYVINLWGVSLGALHVYFYTLGALVLSPFQVIFFVIHFIILIARINPRSDICKIRKTFHFSDSALPPVWPEEAPKEDRIPGNNSLKLY